MISETLQSGLQRYRIGPKIRALRTAKDLGLAQLGQHTGLSAGMLSKIEREQLFPTLPTLLRIAMVFGVGLEHFFADEGAGPVTEIVRAKDRLRLPNDATGKPSYHFESLDFPVTGRQISSYLADFVPGADPSTPHAHGGIEQIFVIEGQLDITIHGKSHLLRTGDAMYFDSGHDHSYQCIGPDPSKAMVVTRRPQV